MAIERTVPDDDMFIRAQIAVVPGPATHALNGVHNIGTLSENGVSKVVGPGRVGSHHVKHRGEWKERENAWIPGEMVILDRRG